MRLGLWILALAVTAAGYGQTRCSPDTLAGHAGAVNGLRKQLEQVDTGVMNIDIPPQARDLLTKLKDALAKAADEAVACAGHDVDAHVLQAELAERLEANPPQPPDGTVISKVDHRFDEAIGSYGHNLLVRAERPSAAPALLQIEFSINIECGEDNMLLLYAFSRGGWHEELRWQAPPLRKTSDAFGDFFLVASLTATADGLPRLVVAHGKPWCTSRFSEFAIDVLTPTPNPASPKVLWHTQRGYSRFEFAPRLSASGGSFELRLNEITMDSGGFERRVIYRYSIDDRGIVRRTEPLALNARGFVEEWLSAPWSESKNFLAPEAAPGLEDIHHRFELSWQAQGSEFISYTYGPVRACTTPGIFQVEMDAARNKVVPGKPGGETSPLPAHYYHVREVKDGYLMISAPMAADPSCAGPNLMSAGDQ